MLEEALVQPLQVREVVVADLVLDPPSRAQHVHAPVEPHDAAGHGHDDVEHGQAAQQLGGGSRTDAVDRLAEHPGIEHGEARANQAEGESDQVRAAVPEDVDTQTPTHDQ